MKTTNMISRFKERRIFLFAGTAVLVLSFSINCLDANSPIIIKNVITATADTSISAAIQAQLTIHKNDLDYPLSVERFYKQSGYELLWIAPDTVKKHASEAMLMLDCVLQFGLNYADYHPQYLTYERLNLLTQKFSKQSNSAKAAFDITLTDALITYINHLHYGKLNPDYSADRIDQGNVLGFDAGAILNIALK